MADIDQRVESQESRLDAAFAEYEERQRHDRRGPIEEASRLRRLVPHDSEWQVKEAFFQLVLQTQNLPFVLENEIPEGDRHLLSPIVPEGSYRETLRTRKTREYTTFVADYIEQHGDDYNFATASSKLTMAFFGIPVAPLTHQEIMLAGLDPSELIPNAESEVPSLEGELEYRVVLPSTDPLKFLEGYHERSYGFPMLRSRCFIRDFTISV